MMNTHPYNRTKAVGYANKWALSRNPNYYSYDNLNGDCTNFASQCLYAGSQVMNYKRVFGWYYINGNNKAPAWTGVEQLNRFLTNNQGLGPFATHIEIEQLLIGDLIQLGNSKNFYHTLVVTRIDEIPTKNSIYIAAHTDDSIDRELSSYSYRQIRFIHIEGVRKY